MLRLFLAFAIALAFLTDPGLAQRDSGADSGDRGSDVDSRGSFDGERGEIDPGRDSFDDLHDRIDRADIRLENKDRLHHTVDTVKNEAEKVQEATALVDKLRAEGAISDDPAERARIETDVKKELDRIEQGRSTVGEIKRNLEAEIDSSKDLTREQKEEVRSILRDFADKRITETHARLALNRLLGDGLGDRPVFELFLVLFILIVIIGAGFG